MYYIVYYKRSDLLAINRWADKALIMLTSEIHFGSVANVQGRSPRDTRVTGVLSST